MFVDATPDDKLLKMLKYTEEKHMIDEDFPSASNLCQRQVGN